MTRTAVRMLALHWARDHKQTFYCGKFRSVSRSFPVRRPSPSKSLEMNIEIEHQKSRGAHARIRTGDLFLTKEMLYRLSYVGGPSSDSTCSILATKIMPPIDEVLERARSRLVRLEPEQAAAELAAGALLVDTRTESQRRMHGDIPGAVAIDRTVFEWRLDPTSRWRIERATDHDVRVIVICSQGFSSILAAASLQDLGLVNATDVIGGFEAWKAAGLPVTPSEA